MSHTTYSYEQLHEDKVPELLSAKPATADSLICDGRRPALVLNGSWHYGPDIYDTGVRAEWYREKGGEFERNAPADYDFEAWETAELPSCWNTIAPELSLYEGSMWFFRTFGPVRHEPGDAVALRVGAANYATMVFVNGEHAGSHIGGFTPFSIDVTPHLNEAENRIHIWVSNRRSSDGVPAEFTDWFNYGGIFRDIALYIVPESHVVDWQVQLDPYSADYRTVLVCATVSGGEPVTVSIPGLFHVEALPDAAGEVVERVQCRPELWSPDAPTLYDVTLQHGPDVLRDRVGFRTLSVDGEHILLNGLPLFLRGASLHEETVDRGRALTGDDRRRIIADAKELGCNCLRLAHYPHHEDMARLADENGLLLWEEVPVYWNLAFENSRVVANAQNQLRELLKRDRNRASVALISVGNENPDTDERLDFMRRLVSVVRTEAPDRLVTAACLVDLNTVTVSDRLVDYLDAVGVNEYYGWYYSGFDLLAKLVSRELGKPVLISEFGAGAVSGLHGSDAEYWTEELQARVYEDQFEVLLNATSVAGTIAWTLYDFKTPRRMNAKQKMYNLKGLIDKTGTRRKLAFGVVARRYHSFIGGNGDT